MIAVLTSGLIAATATAYSPCSSGATMADGTHTRWGSVANNQLPLGTRIRLARPVHGRRVFTVRDRGGMRGWNAVDIFMPDCRAAVRYGRRAIRFWVLHGHRTTHRKGQASST
jgi:3D (Asp-Asp-Asp) domain-containing protein